MARSVRKQQTRGRTGGRSGGAGYDYQDIYVALQLARLLIGTREQLLEVLWEKRAVDWGKGDRAEAVFVDDVVLRWKTGKRVHVQVKEAAPSRSWSVSEFDRSGVLHQFWREWSSKSREERVLTILRLASGGDVTPLNMLVDVARRSRTPSELMSEEASEEVLADVAALARSLDLQANSEAFLDFLKAIEAEQLPQAAELEGWITRTLAAAGERARELTDRLIRLVARSKHAGPMARAAHTRESLVDALREDGLQDEVLIAIGALRAKPLTDHSLWDRYRAHIVDNYRSLRVYGLHVKRAVYADLPTLFVPLAFAPLDPDRSRPITAPYDRRDHRSLTDRILAEDEPDDSTEHSPRREEAVDLPQILSKKRRIAIVGGPGSGKTTTLKWLAIAAAMPGEDWRQRRVALGLPSDPQIPLYVRFRQFAERVRMRGLYGVEGRVGLVADFIGAQFEAGLLGTLPTRGDALQIAQELLDSEDTLLLFDGLDEVADETTRTRLFEAVADLIEKYKAPRIVITSRPYAFMPERSPMTLSLFEPLPLDRAGRRTFAKQWYRSVRLHLGDAVPEQTAETLAEDLARTAERLADLAEVPLLLSILALVHFNRQGLPIERATLYDHATLAMLGHWDRDPSGRDLGDQAIPPDWQRKIGIEEAGIRRVVEGLAQVIQTREGGGEFGHALAVSALAEGFKTVTSTGQQWPPEERAELLLRLLVDRSGLVQERSPGTFAFAHLSFQEYLSARWFVGRGEPGVRDLARLSGDDRHAEVIRLAVSILASDQRTEADERARTIIESVSEQSPILAAACLIEAPRLAMDPAAAASLAKAIWSECSNTYRRHYHPRVISRLVWALLAYTARQDELLLEFLSQGSERRHRMEFEGGLELLIDRPPSPLGPALRWVLERLAAMSEERHPIALTGLASLLLVEAGASSALDHLPALIRLLRNGYWRGGRYGRRKEDPAERAARILTDLLDTKETKDRVRAYLESALSGTNEKYGTWHIAQLLLKSGAAVSASLANALVQGGLYSSSFFEDACVLLQALMARPDAREVVVGALRRGAMGDDADVRRGCLRLLGTAGEISVSATDIADEEALKRAELARLRGEIADPKTALTVLPSLAEDLWDDTEGVVLRAVRALLESGLLETPGIPQALVNVGLNSTNWSGEAAGHLRDMLSDSRHRPAVRAALLDGLRSDKDRVATASALLLLERDEAIGERQLQRMLRAVLKDPDRASDSVEKIRRLLDIDAVRPVVLKVESEYFGGKPNVEVAGRVAKMTAEAGYLDAPNLALGLVLGGLASSASHSEVISHLRRMLDDPRLVTEARRALARGVSSDDARVAWGAARCLWEAGTRTEKDLPETIIRTGLEDDGRKGRATEWLSELLRQPRTTARAISAVEQAMYGALNPPRGNLRNYDLAWEVAGCLRGANLIHVKYFVEALVYGGLGRRERHDNAVAVIRDTLHVRPEIRGEMEENLFDALRETDQHVSWGAVRALIELERVPPTIAADLGQVLKEYGDDDEVDAEQERAVLFLRVVLREAKGEPRAADLLRVLKLEARPTGKRRDALMKLLGDKDASIAYAASSLLLRAGEEGDVRLSSAVIRGGLAEPSLREEAARTLDHLIACPSVRPGVSEALNKALWGEDRDAAWAASCYLMDRGQLANAGVSRGIVFGGLVSHDDREQEAERRIGVLLSDSASRELAMEALAGGLYGEYRGERFHVASLLVRGGGVLTDRVMQELGEHPHRWPVAPLSLLALADRVSEAREAASRLGLNELSELLGDDRNSTQGQARSATPSSRSD